MFLLCLSIGVAAGFFVCRRYRQLNVLTPVTALAATRSTLDREIAALEAERDRTIQRMEDDIGAPAREIREELERLEGERSAILERRDGRIRQAREAGEAAREKARRGFRSKIRELRQSLERELKPRPKEDARRFPAYLKAKELGFEDGRKPSESRMSRLTGRQMDALHDSLDATALQRLQLLIQFWPNDRVADLYEELLALPPHKRSAAVRRKGL
jgi:hypothetical protein